jgi:Trp operon repressor
MSETILAALIAAGATILTSLLQLRSTFGKDLLPRAQSSSRGKKGRMPALLLTVMLTAAAVGGFAVSQWFTDRERVTQRELREELQARITEISRTANQLTQARLDTRAEVETDVLRRLGGKGVMALMTVAPCKPVPVLAPAPTPAPDAPPTSEITGTSPPLASCAEAEATEVMLCAAIPANAVVSNIQLFSRNADADLPWNAGLIAAGQEAEQARFSEKFTESAADDGTKHVCHNYTNWSTQRSRVARMIVRYAITEEEDSSVPQTHVRHEGISTPPSALAIR